MRLCPKRNLTIAAMAPALLLMACTLAAAQSVPVTVTPVREIAGHARLVRAIAFSPDGRSIASGSLDKTIRLSETETGALIRSFQGHADEVTSIAFSPDGRWIASASRDKTVRLWEIATETVRTLAIDSSERPIVAFSPDGRLVATASLDRPLTLWDAATLTPVRSFAAADAGVFSIAFSSDGKWLGANRGDKVMVWQMPAGDLAQTMEGHSFNVLSVAFSPDGRSIVSASPDATIRMWDTSSGKLLRTFSGHQGTVVFAGFAPDARWIVSASDTDNLIPLWDPATGRMIRIFEGEGLLTTIAVSADGRWIASAVDKAVKLWSTAEK